MHSIEKCDLPDNALLLAYRNEGTYTDCYTTVIDRLVSQDEYIQVFYTTALFKLERILLKWIFSKPSTDEDARLLATARVDTFAAWTVESRRDDQVLLSDYRGRTRSWLMSKPFKGEDKTGTRLYFGSAVVPVHNRKTGEPTMGKAFSVLLPFHKVYSQALLLSARTRLSR